VSDPASQSSFAPPLRYPLRRVTSWQLLATLAIICVAAVWAGGSGALSALLGGLVNVVAAAAFAFVGRTGDVATAGAALRTMLRAEAAKIAAIVVQLWLVLTTYGDVVHAAFFSAFVVTVLVSQAVILIRD
jgi:ATP synthase protein I